MGQYYHPIILASKNTIKNFAYSHDYKTNYVINGKKVQIGCGLKLMEHSYVGVTMVGHIMRCLHKNPQRLVWAGDYAEPDKGRKKNLYSLCNDHEDRKLIPAFGYHKSLRFAINHSKKEYVDIKGCPKDKDGWQIHPVPLLTAEGNGQGGGDYWGFAQDLVGTWARDIIETVKTKGEIPKGYREIKPDFCETRI